MSRRPNFTVVQGVMWDETVKNRLLAIWNSYEDTEEYELIDLLMDSDLLRGYYDDEYFVLGVTSFNMDWDSGIVEASTVILGHTAEAFIEIKNNIKTLDSYRERKYPELKKELESILLEKIQVTYAFTDYM